MTQQSSQEAPPAMQLTQMLTGFMTSQAISAAARFGLADQLAGGPRSAEEVAQTLGLHPRALYRLLRALASVGIFSEDDERRFHMTPLAEPLRSDSPNTLRSFAIYMGADWHFSIWGRLPYSIEAGLPAFEELHGKAFFDYIGEHPEPAREFNDAMTSFSAAAGDAVVGAYDFSSITKLVDVGGGHGRLLSSVLERYPEMRGVLYDAPSVVEGAQGLSDRCERVGGNFFESAPAGGDGYIMKHIIHDWDDEHSIKILRNCREAMQPNGRVLIVEMIIPAGNAPSFGKFLDLEMLLFLHSFERTEAEYRDLLERAGLELTRIVPTPSPYSVIEGVRKS